MSDQGPMSICLVPSEATRSPDLGLTTRVVEEGPNLAAKSAGGMGVRSIRILWGRFRPKLGRPFHSEFALCFRPPDRPSRKPPSTCPPRETQGSCPWSSRQRQLRPGFRQQGHELGLDHGSLCGRRGGRSHGCGHRLCLIGRSTSCVFTESPGVESGQVALSTPLLTTDLTHRWAQAPRDAQDNFFRVARCRLHRFSPESTPGKGGPKG